MVYKSWTAAALMAVFIGSAAAAAEKVAIVADEWPQMEVLAKYLNERGGYEVEMYEQDAVPRDLSEYAGAVEFIHGAMADETGARLMDYANNGGRLIVLHHGVSSKKIETDGWYEFMGMSLDRTPGAEHRYVWIHGVDLTLVNLNPGHYIVRNGVNYSKAVEYRPSDFPSVKKDYPCIEFPDTEVFLNHQFTDGREKTVLFGFIYTDAETGETHMQDRGGWYKRTGKGWLFYFMPGHTVADLDNPKYPQIIMNCLTWRPGLDG